MVVIITIYHHLLKNSRRGGSRSRVKPQKQTARTNQLSTAGQSDDLVSYFKYWNLML